MRTAFAIICFALAIAALLAAIAPFVGWITMMDQPLGYAAGAVAVVFFICGIVLLNRRLP